MQAIDRVGDVLGQHFETEFSAQRFQQVAEGHVRIENINGLELRLVNAFQIRAQDGGFPQAYLTNKRHKSLAFFDTVHQRAQSRLVAGAQKEKFRIRRDVKRRFFEVIKIKI